MDVDRGYVGGSRPQGTLPLFLQAFFFLLHCISDYSKLRNTPVIREKDSNDDTGPEFIC